jgi:tRNA (guanine37-N1)-methyltransferase
MINFKVLTIFPELFPGPLGISVTGSALQKNLWQIEAINIRDYAKDKRGTVDDAPYGGGAGMVFKADVVADAIESASASFEKRGDIAQMAMVEDLNHPSQNASHFYPPSFSKRVSDMPKIIYLSPRGKKFTQKKAQELAKESEIILLCGRYEGVDQRVLDEFEIEEISIGDYVLSGGEIAAYVVIDAILRNVDGVLGADESLLEESFGSKENSEFENLLEYPHYTRPQEWRGRKVPQILTSGHHKNIQAWRKEMAIKVTKRNRPDLL